MQHALIASPFMDGHLLLRPGQHNGLRLGAARFKELADAHPNTPVPQWTADAVRQAWGLDLVDRRIGQAILVRKASPYGYVRASYEINLGCNYDCEFCYLGEKRFEGMSWEQQKQLLGIMADAGVVYLQITGGEALIDRRFPQVYAYAYDLGMMMQVSTNGSRLHSEMIQDLFRGRPPYRLTISVYGATEATYDAITKRRGSFERFIRGLDAAREAGLPMRMNVVVAKENQHEVAEMEALAEKYGPHNVYGNMSLTIGGDGSVLATQSIRYEKARRVFKGCNAGHTFFHADPFGQASICKIGRDPQIDLMTEGVEGLRRLGGIADSLMLRTGGCSGCALSGTCRTCRPLAKLYQEAKAPLVSYCQHTERDNT
ncbi:radical SAM protein [Streptomyces sp. NBC_01602]|uniref:radical SAM protein n=1 Tax=Streptomyces sp. NBC_01602 TaxID=2975893 RepID=UPI00386BA299|nr:radical SAM protein [Streptomyces sp. NBC_01602]